MSRLIDIDVFREENKLAEKCVDCKRDSKWECDRQMYSAHDICGWLDDAEIVDAEPARQWISVNDRLPEIRHAVLAFAPHYKNIWALSLHEDGNWYYWTDISKRYDPLWMGHVTHWMPLPEPPKEDEHAFD